MIDLETYKFDVNGELLTAAEINERWPEGVEVKGDLKLSRRGLTKIPFKIKSVGGDLCV